MSGRLLEAMESRLLFARALGLDISSYQTVTSWSSIAATKSFVYLKATEGVGFSDSKYASFSAGAKAAGLKVGVYHYAHPDLNSGTTYAADATAEANYFYSVGKGSMGAGFLPPALDLEDGEALSTADLTTWTNAFNNRIKTLCGVTPSIYVNSNYAGQVDSSVAQWPLWIANINHPNESDTYNPNDYQWPTWKFWQYDWMGTVSGISGSGNVDLDVFNGTPTDLNNFIASYSTPPAPAIQVQQSVYVIANNQTTLIDFGTVTQGNAPATKTFTVSNTGTADLTTSNVIIPAGYTVLDPLKTTIPVSSSDSLTLQLDSTTPGTFAGNISFSTNVLTASTFRFPITGKVLSNDTTPPTITAANFNYASATPSATFTFSENVASSLSLSDFVVTNDTANTSAPPTSFAYNASSNTATLSWSGALANGNYTASVAAAGVSDTAGNAMTNSYAFGFFALAGDINRDRKVDVVDLGVLSSHWQATSATFADGDLNLDGSVDVVDLGVLSSNWQQSLATPAQPDGLRVTPSGAPAVATSSRITRVAPAKIVPPVKKQVPTSNKPISAAILV